MKIWNRKKACPIATWTETDAPALYEVREIGTNKGVDPGPFFIMVRGGGEPDEAIYKAVHREYGEVTSYKWKKI